jgi:hypothetical protein
MPTQLKIKCPCGSPAEFHTQGKLFNGRPAWFCARFPEHDSYVGAHATGEPLGTLAESVTRGMRYSIHRIIDPKWQSGVFTRSQVYHDLAKLIGKPDGHAHIGSFNETDCRQTLKILREQQEQDW